MTLVKQNLPANAGAASRSLGQKDPLEEKMATQSSILAWRIPWTEKPGRLQFMGVAKSQTQQKRPSIRIYSEPQLLHPEKVGLCA